MSPVEKTGDKVLVERSLSGDSSAYGVLVERYSSLVAGIARHYGARSDSEDLVQEVFLRAWRCLRTSWVFGSRSVRSRP